MNISPLSDVVVVKRQSQQEISEGGIIIPPSEDFREDIGTVKFAGKGKPHLCPKCNQESRIPMDVKEGDKVIFSTHGHQLTQINGEELIVLRQDSIIGVIDD